MVNTAKWGSKDTDPFTDTATVGEVSRIVKRLEAERKNASWVAFSFGEPHSEKLNLQFSIENGALGMDWVLIGPGNIRDRDKVVMFVGGQGKGILEKERTECVILELRKETSPH
ncbi:MAG: hypothetical protein ACJ73D_04905 [Pyrinomonadaceae bacterium]